MKQVTPLDRTLLSPALALVLLVVAAPPARAEIELGGFAQVNYAARVTSPDCSLGTACELPLGEERLQLKVEGYSEDGLAGFSAKVDLFHDAVDNEAGIDVREVYADLTTRFVTVRAGRQIITWGVGDLLFVNDLFPKDWQSFFTGRDLAYLKAPSDAVKVSLFGEVANVDLVYMPRLNPSRFIAGRRLSYYSGALAARAGRNAIIRTDLPNQWFDDSEWALRASRKLGSAELAAYGHWGYWSTPEGFNPARRRATYPRLSTYGGSVRGPVGRGIANLEAALYDSRQDRSGNNPMVTNGQIRLLGGYETDLPELAPELTLAVQYYVETMQDYSAYHRALPPGTKAADRNRHVVTGRLTKKLLNQNLTLSLFGYYSPSDADAYLRPNVKYKIDDHWTAEGGSNIFIGKDDHTFFGQFTRNTNIYAAVRYAF